ncbi:MAG: JAB-like toxin 1 domain-containing protein [Flavobacteriaceae bacterium]|uniref:RHS repeat-associated core domain-containing protein n=1 Tax=Chryseobacterium taichungense TaxID=295069 RepID=A0A1H8A2Z4_9FLAO|nr:JAB-like toxin 1 domain-containing protein [Chryseobacterium taichungense]SEM64903.1 RHS repeat-associated core domain-containing protein [Chryseobacterium taichungense]
MKKLLILIVLTTTVFSQAQVKKKTIKPKIEKEWVNPVKLTKEERNRPYMDDVLKTRDSLTPKEAERRRKNIAAGNPFAKYGYYPKVATLSRGKYLEFHDKDSIVIIGSVKYNTKQQKVIEVLDIDLSDPDAQPIGDTHGRWMSPDPLSEEFPDWTPYRYGFNNPVRYGDPTGLLEDDYGMDDQGNITLLQKTNDNFDRLFKVDNSGNKVDVNSDGKMQQGTDYVQVNKPNAESGSIISSLATNYGLKDSSFPNGINFGRTANANDAANVFSFAAKNSNVEWGLDAYNIKGNPLYTVYTGHEGDKTPPNFRDQSLSKLLFSIHSHKNLNQPSPINGLTDGDYGVARYWDNQYYNRTGKTNYPAHYLYYAPNGGQSSLWKYHWLNKSPYKLNLGTGTINLNKLGK